MLVLKQKLLARKENSEKNVYRGSGTSHFWDTAWDGRPPSSDEELVLSNPHV